MYAPIAAELAESERIFHDELGSRFPFVQHLVDHCADFQGKRLRPALVLLTGQACGRLATAHPVLAAVVEMIHTATLVHDDILDEAMVRAARRDRQRRVGQRDGRPARRLPLHPRLPPGRVARVDAACRWIGQATNMVCEGEMQQVHHRGNLELDEADYFDDHPGQDRRADRRLLPPGRLVRRARPSRPWRPWSATAETWASPFRSPTTCSISGARSG